MEIKTFEEIYKLDEAKSKDDYDWHEKHGYFCEKCGAPNQFYGRNRNLCHGCYVTFLSKKRKLKKSLDNLNKYLDDDDE